MISASLDLDFQLPEVNPLSRPMPFTDDQIRRVIAAGLTRHPERSPLLECVMQHVRDLRGSSLTWAFDLSLGDFMTWTSRRAPGSAPNLRAPVTFFKPEGTMWAPKVVVFAGPAYQLDLKELTAYHTTCRRVSMEFLYITDEHMQGGYLDRKDFKRAFNGAFFCHRTTNHTIFCPTLRDMGYHAWSPVNH